MRKDGNNILVTLNEWQASGLTYCMYEADKRRGYLRTANRGCFSNGVEIIWQSIAKDDRKKAIIAVYGNPEDICATNQLSDWIMVDTAAQEFFNSYKLPDGRHLPAERIAEYVANVNVLNAIIRAMNDRRGTKRALGGKVTGILATLTDAANRLNRDEYPHSLPTNERRLRDVIARYKAESYAGLIHKNFTNKHAAKVDNEVKESLITELLSDPRNLDNEQIAKLYNIVAEKMDWKKITAAAVGVWRTKLDFIGYIGRRGETAFRNTRIMQVKRSAPSCPLYLWTADGWDVELLFQETKTDKKGHSVTTYHHRPTVVVVLDPCEKYPIGYAVGDHESPELIKEAFRNAVNHTAELFGHRHRAHQVQTDHYAIKSLASLYAVVADKHTPARVKNAKAKVVEPYFGYLNKTYCHIMPNWSGFGVTANKNSQPNVDYINKFRHTFPDREMCYDQVRRIIELERSTKREKYLAKWANAPDEHRILLEPSDYLYYFGASTGKTNLLEGSGLRPTIDGIIRNFDCFDLQFREHYGVKWQVLYDPANLSQVLAVNEDGTLRFILEDKYVQPMALRDRKDGDAKELERVNSLNKLMETTITHRRSISSGNTYRLFNENPQLNDTLTKMLIVDSTGQHKNHRNNGRALQTVEEIEAIEPVYVLANGQVEDENEINPFDLY